MVDYPLDLGTVSIYSDRRVAFLFLIGRRESMLTITIAESSTVLIRSKKQLGVTMHRIFELHAIVQASSNCRNGLLLHDRYLKVLRTAQCLP